MSFYRDICEGEYENEYEEAYKDKLHEAREMVLDLVNDLYSSDALSTANFESNLEELCHIFRVKLPSKKLQIQRVKQPMPAYLTDWLQFNNNYSNQLVV